MGKKIKSEKIDHGAGQEINVTKPLLSCHPILIKMLFRNSAQKFAFTICCSIGGSRGNGLYWIDPNGGSTDDLFQAFCDMETESGGWTLVATKVSPSLPSIIKPVFSALAAKTTNSDAASHIHPSMRDWKEVMFRFADVSTIRVIYNRKAGAPQKDKEEFDKFFRWERTCSDFTSTAQQITREVPPAVLPQ